MHLKKTSVSPFRPSFTPALSFWITVVGVFLGLAVGVLSGANPLLFGLLLGAAVTPALLSFLFSNFEKTVLGLLILRSSLDNLAGLALLSSVFGLGFECLTVLYVMLQLFIKRTVQTNSFFWLFIGWWVIQGWWLILLPLGELGLDASFLAISFKEWLRLLLWPTAYMLVMQMKNRIPPEKVVNALFFSLIMPITMATMQIIQGKGSRIGATFGHPNVFATYVLLFIALTLWKLNQSQKKLPWFLLLGVLAFFFVSTKALFSLMMLVVFVSGLIAPRVSLPKLLGGILLVVLFLGLFASSEFGQERLASIANTPLLNPDIDISRAILLSNFDGNSFNWRLSQWYRVLSAWQQYPIWGYGLGLSSQAINSILLPHNDYIRALAEGGVIGFGIFITFFAVLITRVIRLFILAPPGSGKQNFCLMLSAFSIAILVGMVTENIWSHTILFFYLSVLLAIADWDWDQSSNSKGVLPINSSLS
jgi:O-antigen ligase